MTWGFGEYVFTGCCTAGTFISFHDLFYLVLNVKINNSGVRIVSSLLGSMNGCGGGGEETGPLVFS